MKHKNFNLSVIASVVLLTACGGSGDPVAVDRNQRCPLGLACSALAIGGARHQLASMRRKSRSPIGPLCGQPIEDVAPVRIRVEPVELCRMDQAHHGRGMLFGTTSAMVLRAFAALATDAPGVVLR